MRWLAPHSLHKIFPGYGLGVRVQTHADPSEPRQEWKDRCQDRYKDAANQEVDNAASNIAFY